MSAIPLRLEQRGTEKISILELCNTSNTLDVYSDRLSSLGYEVISADNYTDAIKLARQYQPEMIVVYDDPATGIDAFKWIEMQHTDRLARLAVTPLLILADHSRIGQLRIEELADRVVVLQRRADTLNQLTRTVKRLLQIGRMDW
ncbi:MAG: hypothetical protein ABI947_24960 [Chloroflexota bacterium]